MNILFWSGGKDAYLALQFYRRVHDASNLKLLTTYEKSSKMVPHQNIEITHIHEQSESLGLDLLTVPLPDDCPNDEYLNRTSTLLADQKEPVDHLIFGDWKLEDIRKWREKEFGKMGYKCLFPIWRKSLHELLPVLWLNPVSVTISNVRDEFKKIIRTGETYDQDFVTQIQRLHNAIDPMGENGEFHTRIDFENPDEKVELKIQTPEIKPYQ